VLRLTLEHFRQARPVPHPDVLEINSALGGPRLCWLVVRYLVRRLLLDEVLPAVLKHTLYRVHVVLDFGRLTRDHAAELGKRGCVRRTSAKNTGVKS
jgi:hypothetical protein